MPDVMKLRRRTGSEERAAMKISSAAPGWVMDDIRFAHGQTSKPPDSSRAWRKSPNLRAN